MLGDSVLVADRAAGQRGRAPELAAAGRTCEWCDTVLSRYNPSPWCSVHEAPARALLTFKPGDYLTGEHRIHDGSPHFRCDDCGGAYDLEYQWLTADQRFCTWCKPAQARRSAALELASCQRRSARNLGRQVREGPPTHAPEGDVRLLDRHPRHRDLLTEDRPTPWSSCDPEPEPAEEPDDC